MLPGHRIRLVPPDPTPHPKILVLPGTDDGANLGDLAMLQVALERLKDLWPTAQFRVLTRDAAALTACCPGVEPVPLRGRNRWLKIRALPRWLFPTVRPEFRRHFPLSIGRAWKLGMFLSPGQYRMTRRFVEAMFDADLFLMAGCGALADVFGYNAIRILDTFEVALRCGVPTAMLSQGVGPAENPALFGRASEVLPRLGQVFIREKRTTLPLLRRMSVPAERIVVTGDDAVELAFRERAGGDGVGIGVNLRLARYSSLDEGVVDAVRQVLSGKARRWKAPLLGFPISRGGEESDLRTLGRLFADLGARGDDGRRLGTPVSVVRRLSECRVVVTGSYHGGVFALSQGVPAVCVAESTYYRDKFLGLADQFGAGCVVVPPGEPDFARRLGEAFEELWAAAPALRPVLLKAAERQIASARAAYSRLPRLLRSGDSPRAGD
jgi:polysaccharide pyruvyl transferase WcaK-like protein